MPSFAMTWIYKIIEAYEKNGYIDAIIFYI